MSIQAKDPKETVRREAKEELGIDVEFLFDEPILLTVTKTVGNVAKHNRRISYGIFSREILIKLWITILMSLIRSVGLRSMKFHLKKLIHI